MIIKLVVGKAEFEGIITEARHIPGTDKSEIDVSISTLYPTSNKMLGGKLSYIFSPDTANINLVVDTEIIKDCII